MTELYLSATDEMYRVNTRSRDGDRNYSLYLARRFEFGGQYMLAITARPKRPRMRSLPKETRTPNPPSLEKSRGRHVHKRLERACWGAVARSNSDLGVIAVLNEYGYRPLKKELEDQ